MKKITILSILFFLLNILIVNSQLAKVYNEENLDFDRAYRDNYLQERNYFSDLNYEIVTGGYSQTSKVGEAYYIVDFIIDGTSLAICGNGVCESGENCEGDNCCNGETIELKFDRNNCGGCGRVCSSDLMCEQGKSELH